MPSRKKPAERGHGGLSKVVQAGGSNSLEFSPHHIAYQYAARRYLRESNELSGGASYAAQALGFHFGWLSVTGGGGQ